MAARGLLAGAAIWPSSRAPTTCAGGSVRRSSAPAAADGLGHDAVAALGISSIFAVYTFIGPYVTDAVGADGRIPVALAVFGLGMAVGN